MSQARSQEALREHLRAERWWRAALTAMHRPTGDAMPDRMAATVSGQDGFVLASVDKYTATTVSDRKADHPSMKRRGAQAEGWNESP